jgi:hypothetical protein
MRLNNVDFPAPLGPMRPIRSELSTAKEISLKSVFAAKLFEIWWAETRVGSN